MKKLYLALIAILCAVSANAATLYLKPNSNWLEANARFAVYYWDNKASHWVSMEKVEGETSSIYSATIPDGYSDIIFVRMNPNTTANDWNNKYNQTSDLKVPTDGTNLYTVADGTWDNGVGSWSTYTPPTPEVEAPTFSKAAGEFSEAFELTITAAEGATIYYTLNGEDPTTSSTQYTTPIQISETTTVKAIAAVGETTSSTATATYTLSVVIPANTTFYLKPNSNWKIDNARFTAYFFGDNGNEFVSMEKVDELGVEDGIYTVVSPSKDYQKVIFVRMNPETEENNWNEDTKWNQTADLVWDGVSNMFEMTEDTENWSDDGVWSTFTLPTYHYIYVNDADYPVENLTFSAVSVSDESQLLTIGAVETGSWTITEIERTFNKRFQYVANDANFKVSYSNGTDTTEISGSEGWSATHDWYVEITKGGVTGVNEIAVDENAPIEYYNFQGVRVANPEKGMYIRVQGGKATKVIL